MKTLDLFLLNYIFDPLANWFHEKKSWSIFRISLIFGIFILVFNLLKCLACHNGILTQYDIFELTSNLITIIIIIWYAKRRIILLAEKGGENPLRKKWAYYRYFLLVLTIISILVEFFKDQEWSTYIFSCLYVMSFVPFFYILCANCNSDEDSNFLANSVEPSTA
jgi:ABC-type sugar transport system permease subunit